MNEIAIAYYVVIAASSLVVVKETRGRVGILISSVKGFKFAPITIAILMTYALFIQQIGRAHV